MSTDQGQVYGRGAALAAVKEELRRLVDGRGTVVIFEGGAGMGKSRMLAEVARIGRRIGLTTCTKLGTFKPFPQIEPPSAWLTAVASEMD